MCPSFLSIGLTKFDWCDLWLQSNIISFVCASSSFFYNWRWNNTLNFSEIQLFSFHVFFPMLTVFWCSTLLSAWIVYWKLLMEPNISHPFFWPCWCKSCLSGSLRIKKTWDLPDSNNSWTWCSNGIQTWMKEKI